MSRLIERKLDSMQRDISEIKKIQKQLLVREKSIEKKEGTIVKKEDEIKKHEERIERALFTVAGFTFRRKHLMEVIRGIAGSFLGVGLGRNLLNMEQLASNLSWLHIIGLLFFILSISGLLIYKNERATVSAKGLRVVFYKLAFLYCMAIFVEFLALVLFNALPGSPVLMVKVLIIGSFAAMAGAVSFSLL